MGRVTSNPLDRALDVAARPLRGMSGLSRLLAGVAIAVVVMAVAAWLVRAGVGRSPAWIVGAWFAVFVLVAVGLLAARRAIRALGPWHIAEHLETTGAWRRGALTTVLDTPAGGTSPALHAAATQWQADDVELRAPLALAPLLGAEIKHTRIAVGVAAGAVLALVGAGPLRGTTARLWHPVSAWQALTAPVRLGARRASVARGERATFDLTAFGQRRATLLTRSPGERWQSREVLLDADGRATFMTSPLDADLVARLEAGGRESVDVRVAVRLPAFLGAFSVTAHYPEYLKLESETLPVSGDTVVVPEGTRLTLTGRATTPLRSVAFIGPGGVRSLKVSDASFRGDVIPVMSGDWKLQVLAADGAALEGGTLGFPIMVLPDSAPVVDVPLPGTDTVAASPLGFAVVVSARDDHGLRSLQLEVRGSATGAVARIPLPIDGGDRALASASLDFAALGARPGDTLRYVAVAIDNAPRPRTGRSREFLVRIPSEREQRAARTEATVEASAGLDSVTAAAKRAQRKPKICRANGSVVIRRGWAMVSVSP